MLALFVKIASVVSLLYIRKMISGKENLVIDINKAAINETTWSFAKSFQMVIEDYGEVFGKKCISWLYAIYAHITIANFVLFFFKYVSTTIFMYRHIKNYYTASRERLAQKQLEYEDIKLQIQIVTTKISVREAEYAECGEKVRRALDRLRTVRDRVRKLIANNDDLKRAFDIPSKNEEFDDKNDPQQEQEFILELMKDLKYEHTALSDVQGDNLDCEGYASPAPTSPAASNYTSVSDCQQDCHVKIVKVTNVYKVSYLRNFIKQKRLRRASKHALLKKKMEDTKKLIEDWQRTLNMVINSKLAMLDVDPSRMEMASQKAMGDYKPPHRESSDSDSELSWNHNSFHNYTYFEAKHALNCAHDPEITDGLSLCPEISLASLTFKPEHQCLHRLLGGSISDKAVLQPPSDSESPTTYKDVSGAGLSSDYYAPKEYVDGMYQPAAMQVQCEQEVPKLQNKLSVITEATSSQLAIEEAKSEADDEWDSHDVMAM